MPKIKEICFELEKFQVFPIDDLFFRMDDAQLQKDFIKSVARIVRVVRSDCL